MDNLAKVLVLVPSVNLRVVVDEFWSLPMLQAGETSLGHVFVLYIY